MLPDNTVGSWDGQGREREAKYGELLTCVLIISYRHAVLSPISAQALELLLSVLPNYDNYNITQCTSKLTHRRTRLQKHVDSKYN